MAPPEGNVLTPELMLSLPRPSTALPAPSNGGRGYRFAWASSAHDFAAQQTTRSLHVGATDDAMALRELRLGRLPSVEGLASSAQADEGRAAAEVTKIGVKSVLASLEVAWLDASTILYLRAPDRDAKGVDLWAHDVDSEDQYQVGSAPVEVSNLTSNARTTSTALLVCSALVFPANPRLDQVEAEEHQKAQKGSTALVYDKLWPRHWDAYIEQKRQQLFSARLERNKGRWAIKTDFQPLLADTGLECPVTPSGGVESYAVLPDGSLLAFTAKSPTRNPAVYTTQPIYLLKLSTETGAPLGPPEMITDGSHGSTTSVTFSRDGNRLAWLQQNSDQHERDRQRIVVYSLAECSFLTFDLTPQWHANPMQIAFSYDSRSMLVVALDRGHNKLFSIPLDGKGEPVALTQKHSVSSFSAIDNYKVLVTMSSFISPNEVFVLSLGSGSLDKVGTLAPKLPAMDPGTETWLKSGYRDVHAFILRPPGFDASKKYAMVHIVHGGPHSSNVDGWTTRWNYQVWAAKGYVVVLTNFAGSVGYGEAFKNATRSDLGGAPVDDLVASLLYVLKTYPWIDQDRMISAGGSYGGYVQYLLQARPELGFKALVNHAGVFDTTHLWYQGDELYFGEFEFGGLPWVVPEQWAKHNPVKDVDKWSTPMLLTHGAKDYRVVLDDAIAGFNVLQRQGVPSRLVVFTDEGHLILKPVNALRWWQEIFRWCEQWAPPGPR